MRSIKWIAVAGTLLLLAPATAQAGAWRGTTEQGRGVTVVTGSAGKVKRVNIAFRVNCRGAGGFRDGTQLTIRRPARKVGRFSARGSYRYPAGPYRVGVRVFSRGKLRPDGLFTGDFRVKMRIERGGRFVTRCRVGKTGWSARRVR